MFLKLCAACLVLVLPAAGLESDIPEAFHDRSIIRRVAVTAVGEIPGGSFVRSGHQAAKLHGPVIRKVAEPEGEIHEGPVAGKVVEPGFGLREREAASFARLLADIQRGRQAAMVSGHCVRHVLHRWGLGSAMNQMVKFMISAHADKKAACTDKARLRTFLVDREQTFACGPACTNYTYKKIWGKIDSGETDVISQLRRLGKEYGLKPAVVRAAFTKYLLWPSRQVMETKRRRFAGFASADIQTAAHYVGVYIRWGDKLKWQESKKIGLRSFLVAAAKLAEDRNVSDILLVSAECRTIATELQKLWNSEYGGSCAQDPRWGIRCGGGASTGLRVSMRVASDCGSEDSLDYMADFEMLRGANAVVVTMSSNLSRLLWYMLAANNVENPSQNKMLRTLDVDEKCANATSHKSVEENGPCDPGVLGEGVLIGAGGEARGP